MICTFYVLFQAAVMLSRTRPVITGQELRSVNSILPTCTPTASGDADSVTPTEAVRVD